MVIGLAIGRKPQAIRLFTRVGFRFLRDGGAALLLTSKSLILLPGNGVATGRWGAFERAIASPYPMPDAYK